MLNNCASYRENFIILPYHYFPKEAIELVMLIVEWKPRNLVCARNKNLGTAVITVT